MVAALCRFWGTDRDLFRLRRAITAHSARRIAVSALGGPVVRWCLTV